MSDAPIGEARGRRRGQIVFAVAVLAGSALLLLNIRSQTTWAEGTDWAAQPRFWPAVGLGAMVLFGSLHLWRLPRRRIRPEDWREALEWLRAVEFAVWFMAYVWFVPVIGFLPASLVFTTALTWRMGYRDRRMLWIAAGFGAAVVIVFKGFLQVRIPGGAVYEWLPDAARNFAILYL